jgi:hypothetical protein
MKTIVFFLLALTALGSVGFAQDRPQKPPEAVVLAAEKAEDVIDLFLKKDWTAAAALVNQISQQQGDIVLEMRHNQLPVSSEDLLGYLVFELHNLSTARKAPVQAALAANQVTALLIDLESHYHQAAPVEIARMDYLGREVVLWSQVPNNYGLIKHRLAELAAAWEKLRPGIQALRAPQGAAVASQVSQVVAALQKGGAAAQMVKDANRLLDLVDRLEALYK